jgi:hypothetical protein
LIAQGQTSATERQTVTRGAGSLVGVNGAKRNKLRASEIKRRLSDARSKGKEGIARHGGTPNV